MAIGGHDPLQQGDGKEPPAGVAFALGDGRVGGAVQQPAPVRAQPPQGHRGHHQGEAGQAEDVLHDVELDSPDDQPDQEGDDRDPQQVVDAGGQLDGQGDPADLGGQGEEGDEERRSQVDQRHPGAQALTDQVEHRPPGYRRHPAGHLREQADADDPHDHDPGPRHAEPGAGLGVGDDVTDVHEAADGGEDAQGDGDEPLHPWASANEASCSATSGRGRASSGSSARWPRRAAIRSSARFSVASPSSPSSRTRSASARRSGGWMASKVPWAEVASSSASTSTWVRYRPWALPPSAASTARRAVWTADAATSAVRPALDSYTLTDRTGPVQP